mgnify:FL=1
MKQIKSESDGIRLDSQRREFIKKSTLVGAGIVASSVLPTVAIASASNDKTDAQQQKGYQLTQHVIDYYKSAAN